MQKYDYFELYRLYKALLTDKQSDIFSLYIECDLSLGEISELKGISRQGVSDTINKTKEILTFYEEKLMLYTKKQRILKEIELESVRDKIIEILGE